MLPLQSAAIEKLKVAVSAHLGVGLAVLHTRLERVAANLVQSLQIEAAQAVGELAQMTVRDACLLLAEGPTEQTRALMAPEQVAPHAHQGLGGVGEAVPHEVAEDTETADAEAEPPAS